MNRRDFLKKSAAAVSLMAGSGLVLSSCRANLRAELMAPEMQHQLSNQLNRDSYRMLHYASLAPSGHNSQPWFVKILSPSEWIIGSDKHRWLPHVDGSNREVMLSIGAFVENLVQAASALGYEVKPVVVAKNNFDAEVINLSLHKSKSTTQGALKQMEMRRTVKSHLLSAELTSSDISDFSTSADGRLFYFPSGTKHSRLMAEEAVDNFVIQMKNKQVMEELAVWTRFKDKEARKYRDGLTVDGMEITGAPGFYVRHFMDSKDVMSDTFIAQGIKKIKQQVSQGAGWLVITSDGTTVKDLIETGRRFQRMALTAREKMIALHPMTQTLEEQHGQENIRENHPSSMIPQFMLRVGYVHKYPDPVSLRRPVEWFTKMVRPV